MRADLDMIGSGMVGKEVLPDLVKRKKEQYAELTKEEKDKLIEELEKAKATQTKGYHLSARSCVNDVTKTLHVLENEVFFNSVY
jgi:polyhydroxyalkanoate synthesis regulator phasin